MPFNSNLNIFTGIKQWSYPNLEPTFDPQPVMWKLSKVKGRKEVEPRGRGNLHLEEEQTEKISVHLKHSAYASYTATAHAYKSPVLSFRIKIGGRF